MLALACALVPHTWQERKKAGASRSQGWAYAWRYGGARRRLRLRRKLIGQQPVAWLVCRERWQSLGLWAMVLLIGGGFVAVLIRKLPQESLDRLELYRGPLHVDSVFVGGLAGVPVLRGGAAERAARIAAGDAVERAADCGRAMAGVAADVRPARAAAAGRACCGLARFRSSAFQRMATQVSTVTSTVVTNQSGSSHQSNGGRQRHDYSFPQCAPQTPCRRFQPFRRAAAPSGRGWPWRRRWPRPEHRRQPAGPVLVWHVDGDDLAEREPGYAEDNPLRADHTVVRDRVCDRHGDGDVHGRCFCPRRLNSSVAWFAWWPLLSAVLTAAVAGGEGHRLHRLVTEKAAFVLSRRGRAQPWAAEVCGSAPPAGVGTSRP